MNKVYQYVTDRIIQKMQEGKIPWQKGWNSIPALNYITRKPYRGINKLLLEGGEYLTFKQIQQLKGTVKKGAKAEMVVFYTSYTKTVTTTSAETGKKEEKQVFIPVLKYYNVFNLKDVEGIPSKLPSKIKHETLKEAEQVISGYKTCPEIVHNNDKACYYPTLDVINVPEKGLFKDINAYYSTLFHEMIHSTGHETRLKRFNNSPDMHMFGSESYSKEELIAEIGSAMLCEHVGILSQTIANSAAYLQSWIKVLKNDMTLIVHAAGKAQKAVDYILNIKEEE
jgi:antirestriction protein ArdC